MVHLFYWIDWLMIERTGRWRYRQFW
jgi:hypothetical protein